MSYLSMFSYLLGFNSIFILHILVNRSFFFVWKNIRLGSMYFLLESAFETITNYEKLQIQYLFPPKTIWQ